MAVPTAAFAQNLVTQHDAIGHLGPHILSALTWEAWVALFHSALMWQERAAAMWQVSSIMGGAALWRLTMSQLRKLPRALGQPNLAIPPALAFPLIMHPITHWTTSGMVTRARLLPSLGKTVRRTRQGRCCATGGGLERQGLHVRQSLHVPFQDLQCASHPPLVCVRYLVVFSSPYVPVPQSAHMCTPSCRAFGWSMEPSATTSRSAAHKYAPCAAPHAPSVSAHLTGQAPDSSCLRRTLAIQEHVVWYASDAILGDLRRPFGVLHIQQHKVYPAPVLLLNLQPANEGPLHLRLAHAQKSHEALLHSTSRVAGASSLQTAHQSA